MNEREPSSFRDPSGHVFYKHGEIFRQINPSYFVKFSKLMDSGLYSKLVKKKMLVEHEIVEESVNKIVIKPTPLQFVSYPYEWGFSQLQDAAMLTLDTHLIALDHEMILKDATAYNVQLHCGRPIFIDTLSFDNYASGQPWRAYGQFCRHFLAPLLLMKYGAPDLNRLQQLYLDGIPLDVASSMLPIRTRFSPQIQANIHLHAKSLTKFQRVAEQKKVPTVSLQTQRNIVSSLKSLIIGLSMSDDTEWGDYYDIKNYNEESFKFKEQTVIAWCSTYDLKRVWDIGGNNGHFSRLLLEKCDLVLCSDIDPLAVDQNYRLVRKNNESNLIPLLADYTNPSPGIGFDNIERAGLESRIKALKLDCVLALALIHHLSISANCSFSMLAKSFKKYAGRLVIEFVHPEDSWAKSLLDNKREARSLFSFYSQENFERDFCEVYEIIESVPIPGSARTLYLMKAR